MAHMSHGTYESWHTHLIAKRKREVRQVQVYGGVDFIFVYIYI